MVNGPLSLIASNGDWPSDDESAMPLKPGEYLIKAYIDSSGKIAEQPDRLLGPEDFAGQATIQAQWQIGFPKAEKFSAELLKK